MRVWDIPPQYLCDSHLLGEHHEIHSIWTFLTTDKGGSYRSHPETLRWVGRLPELWKRHLLVQKEMLRRGMKHSSPIYAKHFHWLKARENNKFVHTVEEQIEIIKQKGCQCLLMEFQTMTRRLNDKPTQRTLRKDLIFQ